MMSTFIRWAGADTDRLGIVCFPWAGAGAAPFRSWASLAPNGISLWAARLPGRESRIHERPIDNMPELLDLLVDDFGSMSQRSYVLFGQCSGALIAFELARRLRRRETVEVVALAVTGQPPPRTSVERPDLPIDLGSRLRELGLIDPAVLANPELFGLVRPAIEADAVLCKTYAYVEEPPLDARIVAIAAADDDGGARELAGWRGESRGPFELRTLNGKHLTTESSWPELGAAVVEIAAAAGRLDETA
jgi:medium-chain acyl-[acyl-carrier-protein] hydrolase